MPEVSTVTIPNTNNHYTAGSDGIVRRRGRPLAVCQGSYRIITNQGVIKMTPQQVKDLAGGAKEEEYPDTEIGEASDTAENAQEAPGSVPAPQDVSEPSQDPPSDPEASGGLTEGVPEKPQGTTSLASMGVPNRMIAQLATGDPPITTFEELVQAVTEGRDLLPIKGIGPQAAEFLKDLVAAEK